MGRFSIFLYTFTINCVTTTGARKTPVGYMICFIYSQQSITIISSRKMCDFISGRNQLDFYDRSLEITSDQ